MKTKKHSGHTRPMINVSFLLIELSLLAAAVFFVLRRKRMAIGQAAPVAVKKQEKSSRTELEQLTALRSRHLNVPLSELARPAAFSDIIGQSEGIRALMAALCGPNPQHVILYGPPGVGKTCAARLVLEEAKRRPDSPFTEQSLFVEMDATCIRFDERAIADPLIGSVHDPIYQGAGSYGGKGIPQPKPGAVTRAHCGILFLDEIGELHPMQMNKLLKVLEDRMVRFESAYYDPSNAAIPAHIHDIFENGLPADFRLIGATTRRPEELPPALRSRCVELHFRALTPQELRIVAEQAAPRAGFSIQGEAAARCAQYAHSGRDAVNIVQLASGLARNEGRDTVSEADVLWVARTCGYAPTLTTRLPKAPALGTACILAVAGGGTGIVMELECTAVKNGKGRLTVNGIVEEEELEAGGRKLKRKSTARSSVENVVYAVSALLCLDPDEWELRFNIPGGMPTDGPSAGIPLSIALISAWMRVPPAPLLCATGEITMLGEVRPVGGVAEKLSAALEAGARRALIPLLNDEPAFHAMGLEVLPVASLAQTVPLAFPSMALPATVLQTAESTQVAAACGAGS